MYDDFNDMNLIDRGVVFEAWKSGDLNKMLKVTTVKTNPIDRHLLLQCIVIETYKRRKDERYRALCTKCAEQHLKEFPELVNNLRDSCDGELPRVVTFQNYATILTEDKQYEKAISVCKMAIQYGLRDGTKSGFQGRINRIMKKANL